MTSNLPLSGIKVLELAGLAPVPFCGMLLADFGAHVTRINRTDETVSLDTLSRGKRSISLNLKSQNGVHAFQKICLLSDVLIEPYRPGVMEKLGIGPDTLCKLNNKLIYARLNGYGNAGCYSKKAGHDINYLAIAGVLSKLGRKGEKPTPPINLLGDFGGGGMVAAIGILMALFERMVSGLGQVVDCSITEGSSYISSFLHRSNDIGIWLGNRGENILDTGAPFYDTYTTKDGKYMAVGAIEPQFYYNFCKGMELDELLDQQYNVNKWSEIKHTISHKFLSHTQKHWTDVFSSLDACVTPVLNLKEASVHSHNLENKSFMRNGADGYEPCPAPKLSRSPAYCTWRPDPSPGEHTVEVLTEYGFTLEEIEKLLKDNDAARYVRKSIL